MIHPLISGKAGRIQESSLGTENPLLCFFLKFGGYLQDHPIGYKWLITMVSISPLSRVMGPLPIGLNGL